MILQQLVEFSSRIPDLCPSMYSSLPIKWQVELDSGGTFLGMTPLSGGDGKKDVGLRMATPNVKRTSAIKPLLLTDKASYVLGLGAPSPSDSLHFQSFLALAGKCAEATKEPSVNAVFSFLQNHARTPIPVGDDVMPGDMMCFRVADTRPTDLPSVRSFWVTENMAKGERMQCLLCGLEGPVDKVSPVAIKGLGRIGGQSAGMAIVSANKDAFLSYGAEQALVAPTCRACGEAYANSINYMLATERYRVFVGPSVFLFWTSKESEFNPAALLSQPQEEDVKHLVESYRTGVRTSDLDAQAFYAMSLSASRSRVVIRDWLSTTVPIVQANLARWFGLQRLLDTDGAARPLGVKAMTASLYVRKQGKPVDLVKETSSTAIVRSLVRCAIYGGALPISVLAQAIGRNRAEQDVTRPRASLIKAVLHSQLTEYKEDYMEKLDVSCTTPGYLCGRLLAELEAAQKADNNPRATIVDRYYGAASSAPATVFGNLMRNNQSHMSSLRRDRPGIFKAIDRNIQEITAGLKEFPKVLTLKDQALFALGYYHQKTARWAKPADTNDEEEK